MSGLHNEGRWVATLYVTVNVDGATTPCQATARNRREAVVRALPPEQRLTDDQQQAVLSGE